MPAKAVLLFAVPLAIASWWGLYELTGRISPAEPGAQLVFFALLFAALATTVAPLAAYVNRRFAPNATLRAPWRFLRHSIWAAMCLSSWAWLQLHRAFNLGFAFITALIFIALEVFVGRLRSES